MDDQERVKESFHTPDLYFAAFLQALDFTMDRTEVIKSKKLEFYFREDIEECKSVEDSYFKRDKNITGINKVVSALDYADNIRSLKSLCHSVLKRRE